MRATPTIRTGGMLVTRPVVLIAEELSPATVEVLGPEIEVRSVDGTDRGALLEAVKEADALLVRSATRVDAEVYAAAQQLKVVARAGVGLDNVDVPAATSAGVMVINAPTSNITSAAELAIALILASLRNLGRADASVKAGRWERKQLAGVELLGKTVGVVGFGRIGQLVAERLAPFGVELLAYDPYVHHARAAELGARVVELDELMREADVLTVHMPKTPETTGLIGAEQFALAKPSLHVVNAARGGLIDEEALHEALTTGRIAAAALDVYSSEPPAESGTAAKLLELDNVTLTPHLGASTAEAQEKAGVAVAKSVRLALAGGLVPDAVNVAGGAIDDLVRPGVALADRLGPLFTGLPGESPELLDSELDAEDASPARPTTARSAPDPHPPAHARDLRALPQRHHPARHAARRRGRHGLRHAERRRPGAQAHRGVRPRAGRPAERPPADHPLRGRPGPDRPVRAAPGRGRREHRRHAG